MGGPTLTLSPNPQTHTALLGHIWSSSPLNGGLTIVASATFLAGGSVWTYTTGPANAERLERPGPLNTSVHIQVKDTVHEITYVLMCILN